MKSIYYIKVNNDFVNVFNVIYHLSFFAFSEDLAVDIENFLFTVMSSRSQNDFDHSTDESSSLATSFIVAEELLQLSVFVGKAKLLSQCLHMCIRQMKEIFEGLPNFVPRAFALPAEPIFCPQMERNKKPEESTSSDYLM